MIAQIEGKIIEKGLDRITLDVAGVGFSLLVSLQTLQALPPVGQTARVHTYLHVREDNLSLFGFVTTEEKHLFELCIAVSGIGPKLALSILSGMEAEALAQAIKSEDVTRLCKIPGIGKKTAERLIIELRDKLNVRSAGVAMKGSSAGGMLGDIVTALCNLGYRIQDAEKAAEKAISQQEKQAPVAEILRAALRLLQKDT